MAHQYRLLEDLEHEESMTFLKKGDVIEYMRDLHAYVKVKPYAMIQVPPRVVQKYPEKFQLIPPREADEFTKPTTLDEYTYIDSRLNPQTRSYSGNYNEVEVLNKGNYFMGSDALRDARMAARLMQMILLALKNQFARKLHSGEAYYFSPLFKSNTLVERRTNQDQREDHLNRLIGNCFPVTLEGEQQARQWSETYQPVLYYFLRYKY